jgi:hypothetical protein
MTKARDLSQVPNASLGFKNRIINGAMTFSQRNGTSSVAVNDAAPYVLDRYFAQDATDGAFTVEQSSVAPAGFNNSMLITVTTADASIAAGQLARVVQRIEGFNVADFGFGATNAQPVTLSFWVRSSLTGTFGGALSNSAFNRSYPFSYTINAANTFEYKTITIAGDTTGTWVINNGIGLEVNFGLGVGSTYSGTAGSWSGSGLMSSTGATNLMGTSGATFYITGVQLEKGSTATSFDYRPYGTEELLCQRYLPCINISSAGDLGLGITTSASGAVAVLPFLTQPRVPPSGISVTNVGAFSLTTQYALATVTGITFNNSSLYASRVGITVTGSPYITNNSCILLGNGSTGQILFTGCEL